MPSRTHSRSPQLQYCNSYGYSPQFSRSFDGTLDSALHPCTSPIRPQVRAWNKVVWGATSLRKRSKSCGGTQNSELAKVLAPFVVAHHRGREPIQIQASCTIHTPELRLLRSHRLPTQSLRRQLHLLQHMPTRANKSCHMCTESADKVASTSLGSQALDMVDDLDRLQPLASFADEPYVPSPADHTRWILPLREPFCHTLGSSNPQHVHPES
mmetsp:Transcript_55086/g.128923  ORF Transcript_55086/g.128923 Transcript_55086/m.128923 type:complete len:212 (-) Transcript_55086:471-1106(-)